MVCRISLHMNVEKSSDQMSQGNVAMIYEELDLSSAETLLPVLLVPGSPLPVLASFTIALPPSLVVRFEHVWLKLVGLILGVLSVSFRIWANGRTESSFSPSSTSHVLALPLIDIGLHIRA